MQAARSKGSLDPAPPHLQEFCLFESSGAQKFGDFSSEGAARESHLRHGCHFGVDMSMCRSHLLLWTLRATESKVGQKP